MIRANFFVLPTTGANEAEFAAAFRTLASAKISGKILFKLWTDGKKLTYDVNTKISWKPLIDLYVNQWQKYYQKDYLRLSGYE